ncbi:MAG TPA: YXWGXW repeat-containing protein [Casimicrobiaceae bacterium]|nr:YXWGXW repeat-containing protein [Casimicrobiaceae bacterium]
MNTRAVLVRPHLVRNFLLALALIVASFESSAAVFVSVNIAPPALPVYVQPVAPGPGYIWTPGYWAWGPEGYYWVPGTWVLAPYVGALWTPGYWGWGGAAYVWHPGYWGPRIGFYGGVNYGFGYFGVGYVGGYWNRGVFNYNTAVTNVNVTNIHNTYNRTVENTTISRVSYNGGAGGINAQPTSEERLAERDQHRAATPLQARHEQLASANRSQLASVNHGSPTLAATTRAAAFKEAPAGAHPNRESARGNANASGQHMAHPAGQPHEGHSGERRE